MGESNTVPMHCIGTNNSIALTHQFPLQDEETIHL